MVKLSIRCLRSKAQSPLSAQLALCGKDQRRILAQHSPTLSACSAQQPSQLGMTCAVVIAEDSHL